MNAKKGAHLVSLNVGKPGPLPYRGRTLQSGIVKTPAATRESPGATSARRSLP